MRAIRKKKPANWKGGAIHRSLGTLLSHPDSKESNTKKRGQNEEGENLDKQKNRGKSTLEKETV